MTKLEQLKSDMLNAKEAYDVFKTNNSRELTDEEKIDQKKYPTFIGVNEEPQEEPRMMELTKDNLSEWRKLERQMIDAQKAYITEYSNSQNGGINK